MQRLGIWRINEQGPWRVPEGEVPLERDLEDWIAADPSMLRPDLEIVARQMRLADGRLDLLGLDSQGRWILVELKRGVLLRDVVTQAIDYASSISSMPAAELTSKVDSYLAPRGKSIQQLLQERDAADALDPKSRETLLIVVGAGSDPGLERMVSFMANQHSFPISIVAFHVFEVEPGQRLLVREITEPDVLETPSQRLQSKSLDDIVHLAEASGVGAHFKAILDAALATDVFPRPFRLSVMYTPPSRRDRMLFTVSARPSNGKLRAYVSPAAIAEFFPVSAEEALKAVGDEGWHEMDEAAARSFAENFTALVRRSPTG